MDSYLKLSPSYQEDKYVQTAQYFSPSQKSFSHLSTIPHCPSFLLTFSLSPPFFSLFTSLPLPPFSPPSSSEQTQILFLFLPAFSNFLVAWDFAIYAFKVSSSPSELSKCFITQRQLVPFQRVLSLLPSHDVQPKCHLLPFCTQPY